MFENFTQNTNPILRAMKKSAETIITADTIKNNNLEIESEDYDINTLTYEDKIKEANKIMKYKVNGKKTRAYYSVKGRLIDDKTDNYLIITLLKQYLRNYKEEGHYCYRHVFNDEGYRSMLHFITAGCESMKMYY